MWYRPKAVIVVLSALAWVWPQSTKNPLAQDKASDVRPCVAPQVVAPRTGSVQVGDYWSREDVADIIDPSESSAYEMLRNDQERENFRSAFWARRDPTSDTVENEFEDEHYRRIVYANQLFSGHVVGSKTDRGRAFIRYGPPDSIDFTTLGAFSGKPEDTRQPFSSVPVERWHYASIEGMGCNIVFAFADKCGGEDSHFVFPHSDSEPLSRRRENHLCSDQPLPGLSIAPTSGQNANGRQAPAGIVEVLKPPRVRFKDLEEIVTSHVRYNLLPFQAMTTAVRATEFTDWVDLTIQFQKQDLAWKPADGKLSANLHLFARFVTPAARVAATVEEQINDVADAHEAQSAADGVLRFSRGVPLPAGRYRLDIAVEDVAADKAGTWSGDVVIANFYADQLRISPLILADQIDTPNVHLYPTCGELYIADTRIHPIVPASPAMPIVVHQGQSLGVFFQIYNLSQASNPRTSDGFISYKMVDAETGKTVDLKDPTCRIGEGGEQITVRKFLSTASIPKGEYSLSVTAGDRVPQRIASSTARVRIE